MPISFEGTPEIYRLLRDFTVTCDNICKGIKIHYMRKRPFMLFNEHTLTPDYEYALVENGSYPSGHTIFGWCAALVLSEINPACTESLMKRGYMYGESRVIVGAHWQSDVDAGMLAASVLHAKLHTSSVFLAQMAKARLEFLEKTGGSSSINKVVNNTRYTNQNKYSLLGHQLSEEPTNGLYVQYGRKYLSGYTPYKYSSGINKKQTDAH